MAFKDLYTVLRYLQSAYISKILCMRFADKYTVFIGNDIIELELSCKGRCKVNFIKRNVNTKDARGNDSCASVQEVSSETSMVGREQLRSFLDLVIVQINDKQAG